MLQSMIYLYGINRVCLPYKTYLGIIQDNELASQTFALYRYYVCYITNSSIMPGSGLKHYDSCLYDTNYIEQKEADELMKSEINNYKEKTSKSRTELIKKMLNEAQAKNNK